ncbi:hypothetical protein DL766_009983 [Monosporascus sp. MC13-8B]|uniref:Uncharacterized protein n=1 Tax=Monosporascus cannonballus TaxID=155416 RepID=A0ABY0H6A4_9PEZI|nr:hypothetical protein DL762_004906 [Monosporascus cannonballus]RYO91544.1 hypothetical protein DL763_004925 [Monosporascus cannonballus]RYP12233.1 hypothetical protein DL766_009983 [Monosporascus sp. MC13-8B]
MTTLLYAVFSMVLPLTTTGMAAPTSAGGSFGGLDLASPSSDLGDWLDIIKRYENDPTAGTYLGKWAIIGIAGGSVAVLVLVGLLICCGRAGRWPRIR